ncbi:MAG: prolyl oligopeptidase family serine peptidase [Parahaliea sp.]
MNSRFSLFSLCLLFYLTGTAVPGSAAPYSTAEKPTLELIMSDADWIGNAPASPYWADDGQSVYYRQKRQGEDFSDLYRQPLVGGDAERIDPTEPPHDGGSNTVYSHTGHWQAWLWEGDIYLKQSASGEVQRLTRSTAKESQLLFSSDGSRLLFEREAQFHAYSLTTKTLQQITDLRLQDDPETEPGFDSLRAHQLRKYTTVVETRRRNKISAQQQARRARQASTIYLGTTYKVLQRAIAPGADYLALVVSNADTDTSEGRKASMPNYVTADGYIAVREVRTRVGRDIQAPQKLLLVNLNNSEIHTVDLTSLPAIDKDPLTALRKSALEWHVDHGADREQVEAALKAPDIRSLSIHQLIWSADGKNLAIQFIANDFKDRWLATLTPADSHTQLRLQHHLTDSAWINWEYNDFGWLPDSKTLWYLSEESGYAHFYLKQIDERKARQLSRGNFVVREPKIDRNGRYAYVVANRTHPGNYQIYRIALSSDGLASDGLVSDGSAYSKLEQISHLDGVSSFVLSPEGDRLLILRSYIDRHADLYIGSSNGSGPVRQLTHTVSKRYADIDWTVPDIIEVPSSHTDRPIYSKLYLPKNYDATKSWPAVMFVHGAGYTQNAHLGWPYYFREFMFHTLLTEAGYIVLDMDYRASKGYGRNWRTAIYRNMGHPELEDYLDGIDYLVKNYQVDAKRVGIYGGSYGGFMTFMALFRTPDAFAAGAALRPVADWMHYENDYTRRILNTPLIDPQAYERSSPINHVAGLKNPLLIASGMQDDNVFFQDSVLMVQRLLELKKPDFEMAIYPLDGHGFSNPESWLDEYRRIFRLMEANLKPE